MPPAEFISMFLNTQFLEIYWFFIAIIGIYLAMPVLSHFATDEGKKTLWYFVAVAFVFCFLLPGILPLVGISWNPALDYPLAGGGFIVYAVLGYLISTTKIPGKYRVIIYALGIGSLLLRYFGTLGLSLNSGAVDHTFWGYTLYGCLFLTVAVFTAVKQINWNWLIRGRGERILQLVSSASLGIYLIHMFVLYYGGGLTGFEGGDWQYRIIGPFVAYFVCLGIVLLLKRIPGIKYLVP
jgi:surface polysaccharide O-acyltransferase-like enzyme